MLVMIALGGVAAGILFVGYAFVYAPLADAWERRTKADEEYAKKDGELKTAQAENDAVLKLHPRLAQWNKLSLPPRDPALKQPGVHIEDQKQRHFSKLKSDYGAYLDRVMRNSGMKPETIKVEEKRDATVGAAPKPVTKTAQPLYTRMTFGVRATGPQEAAYRAIRQFQATNLLHEIRGMKLSVAAVKGKENPDPKVLDLDMLVEALVVTGAEERNAVMPQSLAFPPRIFAEPPRDYTVLSKRSLFTGLAEPPKAPPKVDKLPPKKEEYKVNERLRLETLECVKLTMLAYNPNRLRWEATLYDQAQGESSEIRLDTRLYKTFTIYAGEETAILEGKVLWIDEEQLIFSAEGKYFRAQLGDFLDTVWKSPLTASEVKKLGL
jgi:hypothetical protein